MLNYKEAQSNLFLIIGELLSESLHLKH